MHQMSRFSMKVQTRCQVYFHPCKVIAPRSIDPDSPISNKQNDGDVFKHSTVSTNVAKDWIVRPVATCL